MKVIDLQEYRLKKYQRSLEQKISSLSLTENLLTSAKIKTAFKEWYFLNQKRK